jgi:hypothetical protein
MPLTLVPELFPASATSCSQHLPTTEAKRFPNSLSLSATSVLVSSTHLGSKARFLLMSVVGLLMYGALSDERTGLSFTVVAGPCHRNHSQIRLTRDSLPYFTVSHSWLPQPGAPGPRIYIPQEQGGPVIPQVLSSLSSPPTARRAIVEVFEPVSRMGNSPASNLFC